MFNSLSENEQKTLVDKIKEIIQNIKDWVSEALGLYKSDSYEASVLREYQEELNKISKLWDEILVESKEVNQALEKNGTFKHQGSVNGEVRYEERPFAEQVDEVLAGTFDRTNAVYVGKLPKILQDVGLDANLPMLTTAKHLRDANKPKNEKKHHHGLSDTQLKLIPSKIAEPVMIMDSLDSNSNSVVVTDMLDTDKSPVIVIIKVDGKGTYNNVEITSNFLTGYYGRNKFANFISNNVNANTFLYINKKRSQQLSNSAKVQFLGKLNNYDFNTIIRKTRANVKTKISNKDSTGRELSEGQQEYFKDSAVRDENGNLLVMYAFTTFELLHHS